MDKYELNPGMETPLIENRLSLAPLLGPQSERGGNVLFFTGWGMDHRTVPFSLPSHWNLYVVHSYHTKEAHRWMESLLASFLKEREQDVLVVGWSWGVMMAEKWMGPHHRKVSRAIALNGTPMAVHNRYGIPHRVAALTLRSMNEETLRMFHCRMCGSERVYEQFKQMSPQREPADVTAELQFLIQTAGVEQPQLPWSSAVVGTHDVIISPAHQLNYWNQERLGVEVIEKPLPHLPLAHAPETLTTKRENINSNP